jgi:hypothetical protein
MGVEEQFPMSENQKPTDLQTEAWESIGGTKRLTLHLTEGDRIAFVPDPWKTGGVLVLRGAQGINLQTCLRLAEYDDPVRLLEWALDQNPELPS